MYQQDQNPRTKHICLIF